MQCSQALAAAREITLLLDRSNKAVDITRQIYKLADQLKEQEKDWNLAAATVQVNPEELSAWQVREAFPLGDLINIMVNVQRRISFLRRVLLEKAGQPIVW